MYEVHLLRMMRDRVLNERCWQMIVHLVAAPASARTQTLQVLETMPSLLQTDTAVHTQYEK